MSELNLGPTQQSNPVRSILIAAVVLAAIAAAIFYFSPRKTAVVSIPKVQTYAVHTVTKSNQRSGNIIGQAAETEDDLYVAATVHIENKMPVPIFLNGVSAIYTTPEDTVLDATALGTTDLTRIQQIFPALTPLVSHPLSFDNSIPAHSSTQGTILLHFSGLTKATWKSRKSATLTVTFVHESPITITIPQ
jgi:hypothetical protein